MTPEQEVRVAALQAAIKHYHGMNAPRRVAAAAVIGTAKTFEAYINGQRTS